MRTALPLKLPSDPRYALRSPRSTRSPQNWRSSSRSAFSRDLPYGIRGIPVNPVVQDTGLPPAPPVAKILGRIVAKLENVDARPALPESGNAPILTCRCALRQRVLKTRDSYADGRMFEVTANSCNGAGIGSSLERNAP